MNHWSSHVLLVLTHLHFSPAGWENTWERVCVCGVYWAVAPRWFLCYRGNTRLMSSICSGLCHFDEMMQLLITIINISLRTGNVSQTVCCDNTVSLVLFQSCCLSCFLTNTDASILIGWDTFTISIDVTSRPVSTVCCLGPVHALQLCMLYEWIINDSNIYYQHVKYSEFRHIDLYMWKSVCVCGGLWSFASILNHLERNCVCVREEVNVRHNEFFLLFPRGCRSVWRCTCLWYKVCVFWWGMFSKLFLLWQDYCAQKHSDDQNVVY